MEDEKLIPLNIVCRNCSNRFEGNYCNSCGEKKYSPHNKSLSHFLHESMHFLTHLDGRFLRSLKLIFVKPGFLSTEISNGITRKYFPPLNLFLIGVLLYLLFPILQGLNMPLSGHMSQPYTFIIKPIVISKLQHSGMSQELMAAKFQSISPKIAKLLLLIIIPMAGAALSLLFWKRKQYFYDHLTLATEINTFYLYFTYFVIPLFFDLLILTLRIFNQTLNVGMGDRITLPSYLIIFTIYCFIAFKRFYLENNWITLLKSILFLILHAFIVYFLYKLILVLVVLLFI